MTPNAAPSPARSLIRLATAAGAVVTLGGYQSRVVDQCYRLPIFARMNDPALYQADPFVRAFDTFNPHLGYGRVILGTSALVGESAALFGLHAAVLALTLHALWRIRSSAFPQLPAWSDWLLVALFALCRAGNIGTNHLWEDHLLDRQIGYALLWFALAEWVGSKSRRCWTIPAAVGLTAFVHPGLGVLAAALWAGLFVAGWFLGETAPREIARFAAVLAVAMVPWAVLYLPQSKVLAADVDPALFWSLATELQGPQHMRPEHWRASQWWAAAGFPLAAIVALIMHRRSIDPGAARRMSIWAVPIVLGLALSTVLIERFEILPVALAQPFRLATPLRGLCLVLLLPHLVGLIRGGSIFSAARAAALVLCLRSDRAWTAALFIECVLLLVDRLAKHIPAPVTWVRLEAIAFLASAAGGLWWLIRRDTAHGESLLLGGYAAGAAAYWQYSRFARRFERPALRIDTPRAVRICLYAWAIPLAAAIAGWVDPLGESKLCQILAARWRVGEIPVSDMERLAVKARACLPADALVLTPPRDKAFRQWSRRGVVVNVAGSPYQAKALADWAERLRIVAGEPCALLEMARAWPENRVAWETHYEKAPAERLADWARRFGATAVVTKGSHGPGRTLESLGWRSVANEGTYTLWTDPEKGSGLFFEGWRPETGVTELEKRPDPFFGLDSSEMGFAIFGDCGTQAAK